MADDYEDPMLAEDPSDDEDPQEWLTTFADLSMLLLVFFILLFSISTLDTEKFSSTFSSVTQALSGKLEKISTSKVTREEAGVLLDQVLMRRQIMKAQEKVFDDVKTLQTVKGVEGLISANFEDGVITLRLPGDVLFAPGSVELTPRGRAAIGTLRDFFIQHPDQMVHIKGYTDDTQPSGNSRFRDNWEISAMRAVNVLRELMRLGVEPKRLTATGLANLDPIFPNTSDAYRSRNRRVEFVLEKNVVGGQ